MTTSRKFTPSEQGPSLTRPMAAERIGFSARSLQRWEKHGTGPAFYVMPGGTVRYALEDLHAWEAARYVRPRRAA